MAAGKGLVNQPSGGSVAKILIRKKGNGGSFPAGVPEGETVEVRVSDGQWNFDIPSQGLESFWISPEDFEVVEGAELLKPFTLMSNLLDRVKELEAKVAKMEGMPAVYTASFGPKTMAQDTAEPLPLQAIEAKQVSLQELVGPKPAEIIIRYGKEGA